MKNIVIIISVISPPTSKGFTYSKIRSRYSNMERAMQTELTINSIRKIFPESRICLVEGGSCNSEAERLMGKTDIYINAYQNALVRQTVSSKWKGLGEIALTLYGLWKLRGEDCESIVKISGRYRICEKTKLNLSGAKKPQFRKVGNAFSTRLYMVPKCALYKFILALLLCVPFVLLNISLEVAIYRIYKRLCSIQEVEVLGIEGEIGVNGDYISE